MLVLPYEFGILVNRIKVEVYATKFIAALLQNRGFISVAKRRQ